MVKHAAARSARVLIGYEPAGVLIEVTDDGAGQSATGTGFGVTGMRERVEALGGRLEAGAIAGAGFRVRAWLPLSGVR